MHRRTWQKFEQKVAEWFGAERNSLSGGNSKVSRSDSTHDTLFIECKKRKAFSVIRTLDEAAAHAKGEGKIPVVALSETGRKGFWLLCHCDDLTAIANQRVIGKNR